jgi:hypothetical protein
VISRIAAALAFTALLMSAQQPSDPAAAKPDAAKPDAAKPEAPKPEAPKPFADLVKDAKEIKGLFALHRTEDKVYLEIRPEQFDKIYMLSVTCDSGLGERGFYAAEMCGETPFTLRKVNKSVQMVAVNPRFTADAGTPMERAVKRSFAESLLGSAPIASKPHPDRNSILVDAGSLFLADVPALGRGLEQAFRVPYKFDSKNSYFGRLKSFEKNTEIETVAHYATPQLPVPPMPNPNAPPPPSVEPPRTLQDPRSMFVRLRYSVGELPDSGYKPRLVDDRVGFFFEQVQDYSDRLDSQYTPARRYVSRWRLEKEDPSAALSKPKKPIVFWLENTIPARYRPAIRDGVLMWNAAFERIGFKDAIEVREQPDDAEWDAADTRYNTIRWFAGIDARFAQGPSRANPFTGELYDADIRFSEAFTRLRRQSVVQEQNPLANPTGAEQPFVFRAPWSTGKPDFCNYAGEALKDAEFAFDVLETRGIEPDSPEADRLVYSWLREIAAHEVGHTLGMRHNFRASTIRGLVDAQNADVTGKEGLTGSVMDYIPTNLAARGSKQGEYHQSVLGPYDYWAIEYAYKPIEAGSPDAEVSELKKIASRVAEPSLSYATDEDAGVSNAPVDMDPLANRFDLGTDPLAWYSHRVKLSQEVWANMEAKLEKQGEGYQVLRRSFNGALGQMGQSMMLASKYIGGIYHNRDHVGDPNGRLPFQVVPAAKQKEALQLISEQCFAPKAFHFSPQLLSKLNSERVWDVFNWGEFTAPKNVLVHDAVLGMQARVLDRLFHPLVVKRVIDSELLTANGNRFRIGDLFSTIQNSVWAESSAAGPVTVNSYRRALQREHLKRMLGMLLKDASAPEDARTMARHYLSQLKGQTQGAAARATNVETKAHLIETAARIDEALRAQMQRLAF